jgi:hypothetical protein
MRVKKTGNVVVKNIPFMVKSFIISKAPVSELPVPDAVGILEVHVVTEQLFGVELLLMDGDHLKNVSLFSKALNGVLTRFTTGLSNVVLFSVNFLLFVGLFEFILLKDDVFLIFLRIVNAYSILKRASHKVYLLFVFRLV